MSLKSKIKRLYRIIHPEKPQRFYEIDGFTLDMGNGHMLSLIQRENLMYDRFVPYLGKLAGNSVDKWIIDIGANVGDTVAGMIKHTACNILCVEPTEKFYDLCRKNIKGFGEKYQDRVSLVQAYIVENEEKEYGSVISGGTAVRREFENVASSVWSYRLATVLNKHKINFGDVALIKVDTDGYDSECIMSVGEVLKDISPFLYWENQIDTIEQYQKFLKMVEYLNKMEYENFFIFDNFGNYLCEVNDVGLKDINAYLLRMLQKQSTRSFYYVDVLAVKRDKYIVAKETIKEYLDSFQ